MSWKVFVAAVKRALDQEKRYALAAARGPQYGRVAGKPIVVLKK